MSFKKAVKFLVGDPIPMGAKFLTTYPICNEDEPVYLLYEVEVLKEKSPMQDDEAEIVSAVIDYLNKITQSKFTKAVSNTKYILARINEGRTLEDFKSVIDKKTIEWAGDPKFSIYLRPKTLFGSNFEGYLNQKGADELVGDVFDELDNIMGKMK